MVGGAAGDVALNFRQRWNWIIKERSDLIRDNYFRMVSIPDNIITSEFDQEVWKQKVSGGISLGEIKDQLTVGGYPSPNVSTSCRCQIVRSLGEWSGGLTFSESSYYEAWIEVINSAQNFIFMEQQYFISSTGESSARNKIAEAILKRVEVAIKEDRSFRIYIVVPIEVGAPATNYYTRKTLIQDAYTADANASFDQASFDDGTNLCLMSRIAVPRREPGERAVGVHPRLHRQERLGPVGRGTRVRPLQSPRRRRPGGHPREREPERPQPRGILRLGTGRGAVGPRRRRRQSG